jgi:para-nitrobenzyl esterase
MHYVYQTCPCGDLKGIGYNSYSLFRGVRYATAERWEYPQEVTSWDGTFDATFPNIHCSQYNAFFDEPLPTAKFYRDEAVAKTIIPYAENSLRLNVWTPVDAKNAPVLVYIHGGGYESGGGSESGEAYCKQGIVVVTINYRLNAFASAVGDGGWGVVGRRGTMRSRRR